ncbi:PAS domain-containing protein [Notoacmeibacter sp. MSK16QG-6]|uniref:PAS domain-containing protein n=1 Tax=Notoacmeibacter sp. MSK16QG-6 TaxID=2957982 RepID=UPI00209D6052|nr:PAS domain-containing protein [Notoacmeibacter sp. MSK16QG-6]MCP1199732.1 PAS domain-containing protein [Notoacmeibacter sp. MSK16QG-6]
MSDDHHDDGKPQAEKVFDPRQTDSSANQDPDGMNVGAGRFLEQAMEQTRMAICITDPKQDGNPITFVNRAFIELTGYDREEAIGRNCQFLQGPKTDPADIARIRESLEKQEVVVLEILNYRKDGTPFWNMLHIGPIFDEDGELQQFYGSQWEVTNFVETRQEAARQTHIAEELQHRVGNLFGIIASIIRLSSRGETDVATVIERIEQRVAALGRAHSVAIGSEASDEDSSSNLRNMIDTILSPYPNKTISQIDIDGPPTSLPAAAVTPLALTLHELATNSVKYGALGDQDGRLSVKWSNNGSQLSIVWSERPVEPVAAPNGDKLGTGSRIIGAVLHGIGGEIAYDWKVEGLVATITVPTVEA